MPMRDFRVCNGQRPRAIGVAYACDRQRLYKTYTTVFIIAHTEKALAVKPSPLRTE
jgi:hypothetical protein